MFVIRIVQICCFADFYADNFARTYESSKQMVDEEVEIEQILLDTNMPLQSWKSNDPFFNEHFCTEQDIIQSILGLCWDSEKDTLRLAKFKKSGKKGSPNELFF